MSSVSSIPSYSQLNINHPDHSSSDRIRIWSAMHPIAAKVIMVAAGILISAVLVGLALSGLFINSSVPLALIILPVAIVGASGGIICGFIPYYIMREPMLSTSLIELVSRKYGGEGGPTLIHEFKLVVRLLGPDIFKERMEKEILQSQLPWDSYEVIRKGLSIIGASNEYFEPPPRLKEYYLKEFQNTPCSQLWQKLDEDGSEFSNFTKQIQLYTEEELRLIDKAKEKSFQLQKFDNFYNQFENMIGRALPDREQIRIEKQAELDQINAQFEAIRRRF